MNEIHERYFSANHRFCFSNFYFQPFSFSNQLLSLYLFPIALNQAWNWFRTQLFNLRSYKVNLRCWKNDLRSWKDDLRTWIINSYFLKKKNFNRNFNWEVEVIIWEADFQIWEADFRSEKLKSWLAVKVLPWKTPKIFSIPNVMTAMWLDIKLYRSEACEFSQRVVLERWELPKI